MELGKSVGYQFVQRKFKKVYEATLQSTDWPHVRLHVLAAAHLGSEYQRTALQRAKDLFAPASLQIVTIEYSLLNQGFSDVQRRQISACS